jgi:thiol:disulfide interchange protein
MFGRRVLNLFIFVLLVSGFTGPVYSQLFQNDFAAEPDIDAAAVYDKGKILFTLSMDEKYHITDIKNKFFKIELPENEYLRIVKVQFPKGVPYADEMVYKGDIKVSVYVKQLKDITEPVTLKFKVGYQVCQEEPQEVCFPPASKDVDVKIAQAFKAVEIKEEAEKPTGIEDLSSKSSATAYKPKGGDWRILFLAALILLAIGLLVGLSGAVGDDGMGDKFAKAVVVLLLLAGGFLFIKALDIKYYPLKYSQKPIHKAELAWVPTIDEGKEIAKKENKKIMIDTSAEWCVACKELEEYTFSDPEVAKALKDYVLVKLDFTKMDEADKKLQKELKVYGMPTVIFLDSTGKEESRFSGFRNKNQFLSFLGKGSGWFDKLLKLLEQELAKKSLLLFALVFFLGFLASLTPCVYPVIPIVMGYVGSRSGGKKLKGLYLSVFFVLGLAVVYSVFGVIAAMTGSMVGVSFQNPIVVIIISAIFIIMGLSLAGLFEIPVPSSISSKVQSGGGKSEIIGSLLVGGVAGIIAAPCVGPVLIAILSWISQTKDIFLGFWLTFIFSLGLGVIFLLVGTFTGVISAMPKGGGWMNYVKYFFAILLIGGGIYILDAILPAWLNLLLWGLFLVIISVFIGLLKTLEEYKFKEKVYKFIILILFLIGIFMFYKSLELKFFTGSAANQAEVNIAQKAPSV